MQGKSVHKYLIFLVLVLGLSGCSIKFGYRFLDNAIRWQINDYVSLNAQQSHALTRGINQFHRWHQTTQLSIYAGFMQRSAVKFEQETLSPNDFDKIYDEAFDILSVSMDQLIPVITDMLLTLNETQISVVIKNLERESTKDLKSDFAITPAQRLAKRQNKMIKRIVKWTGRLNKEQLAIIAEWSKILPVDKEVRVSRQSAMLTTLSEQLKDRSNPERFKKTVLAHVKTPERFSNAAYKQSYAKRKQTTLKLMSDIYNSLTPAQKANLIASTKKYQADFLYLAPRS